MNKWPTVALGDVADIFTGFPFKSSNYTDSSSAVKLLRGDNIAQGVLRWDGVKRWPVDQVEVVSSYLLKAGDVILAMDRPWIEAGLKFARIREHDLPALLVQRVTRLRGNENLDTGFLHHIIASQAFTQYVLAIQTGTAVPHISTGQIKAFRFVLPSLDEQRRIAHILGTLDDKIELNRQLNATLEQLARTLFQSWFVDFDPVRAKASGEPEESICRRLGLTPELLALFPAALKDSVMGKIPAGWQQNSLSQKVSITSGKRPLSRFDTVAEAAIPIFGGAGTMGYTTQALYHEPIIVTGRVGTLGIIHKIATPVWPSDNTLIIKPSSPFLFNFILLELQRQNIAQYNRGSTQPLLTQKDLGGLPILVPTDSLLRAFDSIVSLFYSSLESNNLENTTLAALRDELLPKLLSGEIRLN